MTIYHRKILPFVAFCLRLMLGGELAILLTSLVVTAATPSYGADLVVTGSVVALSVKSEDYRNLFQLSGFGPTLSLMTGALKDVEVGVDLQPLLDMRTKNIARFAIDGVVSYSILGTARRYVDKQVASTEIVYYGHWGLAVVSKFGHQNYNVPIDDEGNRITGSTMSLSGGLSLRLDLTRRHSVQINAQSTVISFSADAKGVKASETQFGLGYILNI